MLCGRVWCLCAGEVGGKQATRTPVPRRRWHFVWFAGLSSPVVQLLPHHPLLLLLLVLLLGAGT